MRVLGDYPVYINKCAKILALIPMGYSSHRARQTQGEWYDSTVVMRGVRQLHDLVGDDSMRRIGREIIMLVSRIEQEVLNDLGVNSSESCLLALPKFYARYHEGCGSLSVKQIGEREFTVDDDTPYPESLNAGLIEGAVREFGGLHVKIAAESDGNNKRRYNVSWGV